MKSQFLITNLIFNGEKKEKKIKQTGGLVGEYRTNPNPIKTIKTRRSNIYV